MRRAAVLSMLLLLALAALLLSRDTPADARLKAAFRRAPRNGWIFAHLEGAPAEIGYQHGYLLAPEIEDTFRAFSLELTHDTRRDWSFFRTAAHEILWPKVKPE